MSTTPFFPQFAALDLGHQAIVEEALNRLPPYSDHTFSSLYTWNLAGQTGISTLQGNLIFRLSDYLTNEPILSLLGAEKPKETLDSLFTYLHSQKEIQPRLSLIPERIIEAFDEDLKNQYEILEDPNNHDYIYGLVSLSSLRGNKLRGKKNFANRFARNYRWEFKELDTRSPQTLKQMGYLLTTWQREKEGHGLEVENDREALRRLWEIQDHLKLLVLGLFVDEKLVGYTVNELHKNEYATNLFEHADVNYTGVFSFLKQQTALKLLGLGYQYLSHQQDLGLEHLRHSKHSFAPKFFLKKFTIKKSGS